RAPGASQLFPLASSLPWIAKGGTLNRPAEALVTIPDPGRHYSVPVGGIISLWWATSFRYDGRLEQESAPDLEWGRDASGDGRAASRFGRQVGPGVPGSARSDAGRAQPCRYVPRSHVRNLLRLRGRR